MSAGGHVASDDPKYRRYITTFDKILQSFETINEWADIIAFLSKLIKVPFCFVLGGRVIPQLSFCTAKRTDKQKTCPMS